MDKMCALCKNGEVIALLSNGCRISTTFEGISYRFSYRRESIDGRGRRYHEKIVYQRNEPYLSRPDPARPATTLDLHVNSDSAEHTYREPGPESQDFSQAQKAGWGCETGYGGVVNLSRYWHDFLKRSPIYRADDNGGKVKARVRNFYRSGAADYSGGR